IELGLGCSSEKELTAEDAEGGENQSTIRQCNCERRRAPLKRIRTKGVKNETRARCDHRVWTYRVGRLYGQAAANGDAAAWRAGPAKGRIPRCAAPADGRIPWCAAPADGGLSRGAAAGRNAPRRTAAANGDASRGPAAPGG